MQAFYINLDSAIARRDRIDAQLGALGIEGERIVAITPEDLTAELLAQACDPTSRQSVSTHELACTMSHRKAWAEIVARDLPMALILEDDVYLSPRLPELLTAIEPFCQDADVVRVETQDEEIRLGRTVAAAGEFSLRPIHSVVWGCGGYVVTRKGATKLLGSLARYNIPVDAAVFDYHYGTSRHLALLQADPAGVANGKAAARFHPEILESALESSRRSRYARIAASLGPPRSAYRQRVENVLLGWRDRLRRFLNERFRGIDERSVPLL